MGSSQGSSSTISDQIDRTLPAFSGFSARENWHAREFWKNNVSKAVRVVDPESTPDIDLLLISNLSDAEVIWTQFQRSAWHTPFQDYRWVKSWCQGKASDSPSDHKIVLGYVDGSLKFILPLIVDRSFGINRLSWLASEVNDYNCPLVEFEFLSGMTEKLAGKIWEGVTRIVGDIDVFHLTGQPEFLSNVANPFVVRGAAPSSCGSHLLSLDGDWDSLYRQMRSSKSRSRLRQKENKLKRAGKLQFRSVSAQAERDLTIDRILRWKIDQLEVKGDRNPSSSAALKQTIKNISNIEAGNNPLRVYGLYLDAKLVAGIIALVGGRTFSLFVTSYDPKILPGCSTGTVLLTKTLELATRAGLETYDFLAGDETYKRHWCNQTLGLKDSIFGLTASGRYYASVSHLILEYKKSLKSNARAMALLRKLNSLKNQAASLWEPVPEEHPVDDHPSSSSQQIGQSTS